ncbi:alpha/beta hydrolase [Planktotalea sp.]|uniref:alpha/beta hydrolase n=1 Tax=Planktotalea sp. TaxID=2029877 RepID=UPI003F6C3CEB
MKTFFKWVGRGIILLVLCIAALAVFGPREKVDLNASFDPALLGDDLDAYFVTQESAFDDIVDGTEKRVIWAGEAGVKTPVSVLYIHGFSATSEEIRPVPDNVAEALGANLVYTRLAGHGRSGDAMAEASAADWMHDTAEALAAARQVGEQVIVISTSTGGTLVAAAALREDLMQNVAGAVFVSPNFALNSPASVILTWPAVRWWGPIVAGAQRSFETLNDGHTAYWTNSYPTVALMPMAALVKAVDGLDLGQAKIPALFMISDQDQVVSATKNREVAEEWGGESGLEILSMGEGDDPYSHVIAGDILSPGQTAGASQAMIDWAKSVLK